uniref:Uncharacterized protein n=1 Tax=Aegilops tauschii subsp. strangulata TaxID=200361 RepID=A0A452YFM7_AEGTS
MYQSNQARIKKEIPSLLPGRGQKGPRPALSRPPSSSHIAIWYQLASVRSCLHRRPTRLFRCRDPPSRPPPPSSPRRRCPGLCGT